jgi:DNA-binding winged helix-turn-helix (wHTH) protein
MQASILRFDQFELDLNCYELRRSGRVIKLEKLPMELLILLAEAQGQLVKREQIIQRLWGDNVFVDTRQGIIQPCASYVWRCGMTRSIPGFCRPCRDEVTGCSPR